MWSPGFRMYFLVSLFLFSGCPRVLCVAAVLPAIECAALVIFTLTKSLLPPDPVILTYISSATHSTHSLTYSLRRGGGGWGGGRRAWFLFSFGVERGNRRHMSKQYFGGHLDIQRPSAKLCKNCIVVIVVFHVVVVVEVKCDLLLHNILHDDLVCRIIGHAV